MNELSSKPGPIRRRLLADPLPWALWLIVRRTASKVKSAWLGWIFGARRLYLGPGCRVSGSRFIHFGADVYAQGHLWLEAVSSYNGQRFHPSILIGDHVSFSERVHLSSIDLIQIGRRVLVGSGVYIGDHQHGAYNGPAQTHPEIPPALRPLGGGGPVTIGDDVWIGDNAVILGPVSIGRGSIIGANSVVRGDIPERSIAAGAPARVLKQFSEITNQWETVNGISEDPEAFTDPAGSLARPPWPIAQRR
jgi:acetyltransferase-like isoleucine patch superfamily enzyme